MGQRFQTYVSYGNGENLFAEHLQWCWGDYAVIRADQLTSFLKDQIDYKYDYFRLNNDYCYNDFGNENRKDYIILKSLNELNLISHSFVVGYDLIKEEVERNEYLYNRGELKEMPSKIKINYRGQDNNDGALFIKVTKDYLKYCFISNNDLYSDEKYVHPITAREYLKEYKEDSLHISEKDLNDMLNRLDNIELLTSEELDKTFNKKYDLELNYVN